MIRPLRAISEYCGTFLGEYFLGSETARWYSNQRVIATEHLPDGKELDRYLRSSRIGQGVNLFVGRAVPDVVLVTFLYHYPDSKYLLLALAGEVLRVGSIIYHRKYRILFLKTNRKMEILPWEPEDWKLDDRKGTKSSWEDEGEEWKRGEPKGEDRDDD